MVTNYRIYGLDNYTMIIEDSLEKHALHEEAFAIELILTEAMTNAYKHGNQCDDRKSIDVRIMSTITTAMKEVMISISDCGEGIETWPESDFEKEENILEETGRGLSLIRHYSDQVNISNNALHIYKKIRRRQYEIDSN